MKKIMSVNMDKYDFAKVVYLDVSTKKLMDAAMVWIFKYTYVKEEMEAEINDWYEDKNSTLFVEDCNFCDKTGKLTVKSEEIICVKCYGKSKKYFENDKNWLNFIENYKKAKSGDLKAIKKLFKASPEYFENWEVINITDTKKFEG